MVRIRPYKLKVVPLKSQAGMFYKYINTARPTYLIQLDTRQLKKIIKIWYKEGIINDQHYQSLLKFDTLIHFFDEDLGYFVAMSTPTTSLWNIWLKDLHKENILARVLLRVFGVEDSRLL